MRLLPADYSRAVEALAPDIYVAIADEQGGEAPKRARVAVDRTTR